MHSVIRPASTVRDALAMRRVRNSCRTYLTRDTSKISLLRQLRWWISRPGDLHPYVVEADGRVVGYAVITVRADRGWLTAGLLPDVRGHGVGEVVFRRLVADVLDMGLVPWLEVRHDNFKARRLYDKLGFVVRCTRGEVVTMELDDV